MAEEDLLPKPQTDLPLSEKEIPEHIGAGSKPKLSIFRNKIFIIFVVVSFLVAFLIGGFALGRNSVFKELNPTNPPIPSPAPVVYEASPTPNPTADWKTYKVEEINLEYKLPSEFPPLTKSVYNGETGRRIYISAGDTKTYVGPILLGTSSFDYTEGRGGIFVDLQGYTKQGSKYLAKFVSGKSFEISEELTQEITNENGIKILKIKGRNYQSDPNGLPESGTPGEGHIGALINASDSYYPGFAIDMELSDKNNEEVFDQILSTFQFTE